MKVPPTLLPKVSLPGDAARWTAMFDAEEHELTYEARTKDSPPSITVRKSSTDVGVLKVTAELLRDGLHVYVTPKPDSKWAPLHLALRRKPVQESKMSVTAAVLTALALHHEDHAAVGGGTHFDWMKKVQPQVLRQVEAKGLAALEGTSAGFHDIARDCSRLVDRALNKDVDDAVESLREKFRFLIDHVEEEDVVRIWREVLVEKTHDR